MLCNRQAVFAKIWRSGKFGKTFVLETELACSEASLTGVQLANSFLRGFASGDGLQSNHELGSPGFEYQDLRRFLEVNSQQESVRGRPEGQRTELPIGGGKMPDFPKMETHTSRLLGRKGVDTLKQLKTIPKTEGWGLAVTSAIQQHGLTAPKRWGLTGLNAGEDVQELIDRWDEMIKQGNFSTLTRQMAARPRDVDRIEAAFKAAEEKAKETEEKRMRWQREEDIKAAYAASRIRTVDNLGRAYGTGKRKTSIARVWLSEPPLGREEGVGRILVNGKRFFDYFGPVLTRYEVLKPFEATETVGAFDVKVNVTGGGITGQAQAIRHGIAKALQNWNPEYRPTLKSNGYLTRDSRIVERKKPGRKKARKAFQWVKR